MELSAEDACMLRAQQRARDALYIGLDHHAAQLTVAVVRGGEIQARAKPGYAWVPTKVFDQDGPGYVALLAHLAEAFPDVPRDAYRFLSEPSYAKPCCKFLRDQGFKSGQVLWVDTRKVGQFRKVHNLGAGKSDVDDARAMVALLYHAATAPHASLGLFEVPNSDETAELLADYAADHARVGRQMVALQGRIVQLVMLLFPEARRVWGRALRLPKPGGGTYERRVLKLFDRETPLRVLAAFGGPRRIAEAGFDGVWKEVGSAGLAKSGIRRLVELAETSAGLDEPRLERRLLLLVEEYQELERRRRRYRQEIERLLEADPVLASLRAIPCLGDIPLAVLAGAIGDARRYRNADAVKRYLNVAPMPLPQSGDVDERGRPIQRFRMPANSYQTVNGQRRLKYRAPGRRGPRQALYLVIELLAKSQARHPDDPLVKYYRALADGHRGRPGWVGRIRWKVAAKIVETIYYCLKYRREYDPAKVTFRPIAAPA